MIAMGFFEYDSQICGDSNGGGGGGGGWIRWFLGQGVR